MKGTPLFQAAGVGIVTEPVKKGNKLVMGLRAVPIVESKRRKKGGKRQSSYVLSVC
jgi:hypothetical protein